MSRSTYEIVRDKIAGGMDGERHAVRRDAGRLAGGYLAAGKLTSTDVGQLEREVLARSKTPGKAAYEWREAVEFGRRQPLNDNQAYSSEDKHLDWDEPIYVGSGMERKAEAAVIDANWVEDADIVVPGSGWSQTADMIGYLESMFEPDEKVGMVIQAWQPEGSDKWIPRSGGTFARTREELVTDIRKHADDIGEAIGDVVKPAGAWIRINPLDGNGCKDVNVTAWRHALIEADDQNLGKQLGLIRELQLPCSAIVHSGGKSIHALVRVDALDAHDYRSRVDRLYQICKANGLKVDEQNRNPSRLSRLPGVHRGDAPQFLIAGRCGQDSFDSWLTYIAEASDDLPDPEPIEADRATLRPLGPELIAGFLREGRKMRVSGSSKAGKTFLLMELAAAIAEGKEWLGLQCTQGKVLYLDFELADDLAKHRLHDIYEALDWQKTHISNVHMWSLRGRLCTLDKLAPKIIRRAKDKGFKAIILDPIYKIQTGNENDPADVARFCNELDRICHQVGSATIDCHHHSKGVQGQKRSMDRASGSGVFGRDPDAVLDLIELSISSDRRKQLETAAILSRAEAFCVQRGLDFGAIPSIDHAPGDKLVRAMHAEFTGLGTEIADMAYNARYAVSKMSGWRVEANLREFAAPEPIKTWFRYPIHLPDAWELLTDAKAAGEEAPWEAERAAREEARKAKAGDAAKELADAISICGGVGDATISDVADAIGCTDDTVRNRVKKSGEFRSKNGLILAQKDDE